MADLKKGDLVYCWNGDERPEKPYIEYFERRLKDGGFSTRATSMSEPGPLGLQFWDHIEPVLQPERWTDDFGNEIKPGDTIEVWDLVEEHKRERRFIRKGKSGYLAKGEQYIMPCYWLHAKKVQPIQKGTLVLVWTNKDDLDKFTRLAFYEEPSEDGRHRVRKDDGTPYLVDNVRPITLDDLKRWAEGE